MHSQFNGLSAGSAPISAAHREVCSPEKSREVERQLISEIVQDPLAHAIDRVRLVIVAGNQQIGDFEQDTRFMANSIIEIT